MSYNNIRKQQKPYSDLIRHGNAHRKHECKWYRNIVTPGRCSAVTEKDGYLDKLHGFVENSKLLQLYNEFDIICLPSYREGCPKVLLEASARGTPIITTNVVGCKHLIPSSDFGFLVEPFSVSDLVSKLEFIHPISEKLIKITCELPTDMKDLESILK